jgi:hypothetical protein
VEREIDEGGEEEEGVMCEGVAAVAAVACQVHPSASASGAGALEGCGYVSTPPPPPALTGAISSPEIHPKVYIYICIHIYNMYIYTYI